MGNVPGPGHKNLPVSYFCMPGTAGASQSLADPVANPLVKPPATFQKPFYPSFQENVQLKSTENRNEELPFASPFKNRQQDSPFQKGNSESGVPQSPSENSTGRRNPVDGAYRDVMRQWRSAALSQKRRNSGLPGDGLNNIANNSRVPEVNSAQTSSQVPSRPRWPSENREPTVTSRGGHLTFDGIIEMIKEGSFKKIVTVVGAAFSASAGIPHYRSEKSHLHHRISHRPQFRPEDLFHKELYEIYPHRFIDLFKDLLPEQYKPTLSHYFIKLLENKGVLLRHYTQNVDSLDMMAGISSDKLVEAHGSFRLQHCTMCRVRHYYSWWREKILTDTIPRCKQCLWYVLPDIAFIGDLLPRTFFINMEADYRVADLLIVMGTPLTVQPFAFFYNNFRCPRLVINRENIDKDYLHMQLFGYMQRTRKVEFDPVKNESDVLWIGECDEASKAIAGKLGWTEELNTLMEEGHRKLEGKVDVYDENLKS